MGAIDDLLAQALTPHTSSTSSSPLQALQLMTQLGVMKKLSQGPPSERGVPPGTHFGPGNFSGDVGRGLYENWAERFTKPGLNSAMLVALRHGHYPATGGALYARPDLAAAFRRASQAFHQHTGKNLSSYLVSGWRPFQSSSPKATDMRNSDHWLGGAIDLASGSLGDHWLRAHGNRFGFGSQAQGWRWGDPGHFSFTAGGFMGSHSASGSSWGDPTRADWRWIQLARRIFG